MKGNDVSAGRSRFSTTTRLRVLGEQAAERVYRAQQRRLRRPPRRSRLTGRAAVLALVICSLVVALAYPLRQYISQRSDIAEQERLAEQAGQRVEELRDAKARWQDPAYVEQQVRRHLHFVRPGEFGFTLPDLEDRAAEERRYRDRGAPVRPWYDNLWDGVDRADEAR